MRYGERVAEGVCRLLHHIKHFFEIPADQPELNRARYMALTRLIPLMYGIISINMVALAWTHFHVAPRHLTLILPGVYVLMTVSRSIIYLRHVNHAPSDKAILAHLRLTTLLAAPVGCVFMYWEFQLFAYGDALMHGQVLFFAGVTAIASAFCMIHLRQAAVLLLMSVIPATAVFLLMQGEPVFSAVALNIVMVALVVLFVLLRHDRDFTALIKQQITQSAQSSELAELNLKNIHLANTDSLTGLPNRRSFFAQLDEIIAERLLTGEPFIMGLLDLDGFKPVNDVFGHPAGDQLLIDTSRRLSEVLGDDIIVARLGGDEFGLIAPDYSDRLEGLALGQIICDAMLAPFALKEGTANIAATVGLASYPECGRTSQRLFDRADYALCYSKQNSKGKPAYFSARHETLIRDMAVIEHRMREADLDKELAVMFQPIVDTLSNRTVGLEALARWSSPILGDVSPEAFIRTAEQVGTISQLTEILLRKALAQAVKWPDTVVLSFNLSAVNLASKQAILRLIAIIENSGFSPQRLIFEITESAVMQDFERAGEALEIIRRTGIRLALDDFGTGFSSLSYVQRLPIDSLKIDRSFISDIETNTATQNVVRTIADLCRNLELRCVVEGIETRGQMAAISQIGLHYVQGYLFSRPLEGDQTMNFIEHGAIGLEELHRPPARRRLAG